MFSSNGVSTQVQFGQAHSQAQHVQPGSQLPASASTPVQLGHAHSSIQQQPANVTSNGPSNSENDFYLKVLCPENKKEYKTVTLRGLSPDNIDTPTKLKEAISIQCDGLDPQNMEVGYFIHSKKLWINSRLDVNDVWNSVGRGEKVTLWCLNTTLP